MSTNDISRRAAAATVIGAGLALGLGHRIWAAAATATAAVDTSAGKVRGMRNQGVSRFLGIPYGSDTGKHRFQPARAPRPWSGVRDCLAFGAQAPQGTIGIANAPARNTSGAAEILPTDTIPGAMAAIVKATAATVPESEDCLFLNVYTPEASPTRRRPVMVWLHGGGFAMGSACIPSFHSDELCRLGDIVVVTLNHRLGAPGYFYLGAMHDDFADSGNVGQLDIVLALRWVRDNIAQFGGDARKITIFGESGGGWKVGTLLGMPPAHGLFHRAIQQSGPVVRSVERSDATELADRALAELGVVRADVHKLQTMDLRAVIAAATQAQSPGLVGRRTLAPVVDGRSLPQHPFHPAATEISRDVPLIIGTNRDEATMFLAYDPLFGKMSAEQARQRFEAALGERGAVAFELYRAHSPDDPPTYWVTALNTHQLMWTDSVREAERKAAQQAAPVFMYRFDWHAALANGALRATHGVDLPFVFHNLDGWAQMDGDGPAQRELAAKTSQAWINFARNGDPSQPGLAWPQYAAKARNTMIFDANTRVVSDPDRKIREFWSA